MNTVHAQKENVDSNASSDVSKLKTAGQDNFRTPRRAFVVHDDSAFAGKKGLQERSSSKSRRVLDDISNKRQDYQTYHFSGGSASAKKNAPAKDPGKPTKRESSKKAKTPLQTKAKTPLQTKAKTPVQTKAKTPLKTKGVTPLKLKTETKPPRADEAPEIEVAYGGVSPFKSGLAYSKDVHDEIIRDIINDKTPTLFDDFDAAPDIDDWSDERAMLESGEPSSSWWSKEQEDDELQGEIDEQYPALDDVPPPDDFSDVSPDAFDADKQLLEDLLSADVEACTG
ncbi:unnamed protein product [Hyaloperonospora brassicae]|uniref:Uncharacterized protein n=1 Tax=Hyaloperonospora brassicae TaxID=162125 RepID=A0AAV0U8N5_HYABA|nr:unnamed protein product [Hyaloperonospora brassicae]